MKYLISKKCYQNINTFYHNVAKNYKHTIFNCKLNHLYFCASKENI